MSDKDVLGQADALLRRHANPVGTDTGAVPVLTEFFDAPPSANAPVPPAVAPLVSEVQQRVLEQLQGPLTEDLENRVLQHLVPQVHMAVATAVADLQQQLANAIGDAIAEALRERQVK